MDQHELCRLCRLCLRPGTGWLWNGNARRLGAAGSWSASALGLKQTKQRNQRKQTQTIANSSAKLCFYIVLLHSLTIFIGTLHMFIPNLRRSFIVWLKQRNLYTHCHNILNVPLVCEFALRHYDAILPCYSPFLRSIFSLTFLDSYRKNIPYRLRHCADQIIKTTLTVNYKRIMSLAFIDLLILLVLFSCAIDVLWSILRFS